METPLLAQRARWRLLLSHPSIPATVTVLGIVAGLLGALWTDEIKNAFPFHVYFPRPWRWSWHSFTFWFSVISAGVLFFFRQKGDDADRAQSQRQLIESSEGLYVRTTEIIEKSTAMTEMQSHMVEQAARLEQLVRTLPPANFLTVFSHLYSAAKKAYDVAGDPDAPLGTIEQGLRHLLRTIATLAQKFDGDHPDVQYAANVMLFRRSTDLSGKELDAVAKSLRFCDAALGVDKLKGVLELRATLSTTAFDQTAAPDEGLPIFSLPVPHIPKKNGKYMVLPGGPTAFADKEPDVYSDTSQLREWCDENGDFTNAVKDELQQYFHENPQIRSFASIPLFQSSEDGTDDVSEDPIGVLNIHSSKTGLLREQGEPVKHFVAIVRPMQAMVVDLILDLLDADDTAA